MSLKRIFALSLLVIGVVTSAQAEDSTGIIATVGEDAITTQDLVNRTKLIIISSGMRADEETARKIAPQVLQSLINERLQLQEVARQKIDISNDEVDKAINEIEAQNKMKPGQLKEILKKTGIPISTLQQQVKGQIAWAKIRSKKIQPKITVSDDEVDDFLRTQSLTPTQTEYHVNEIVLPVENPKDEQKMKDLADKLTSELTTGKGNFAKIARQFSQSSSAQSGGDVGWLTENQIPKELLSEVKRVGAGKIIGPIKSVEGYFILFIPETRDVDANAEQHLVALRQFEFPFKNEKTMRAAADKLKTLDDPAKACSDSAAYAKSKGATLQDYGSIQVKSLQPPVRKIVVDLPTGKFSKPADTGSSFVSFLVCEKVADLGGPASISDSAKRDSAREILFKRKTELESRKYLRDLRRDTNIEIKA